MVSRQEALFGTSEITHVRMMDPIQYPHFANKLGKGARGRGIGCDFFKIFKKCMDLTVDRKVGGKQESTGKTINAGIKKPIGLTTP